MATTNTQQWNPAAVNQENDAQYAADSQRGGGAVDGSDFLAPLANKLFYQVSTYVNALGLMLASKGYSNSDADVSVLAAVMANLVTEGDLLPNLVTVGFSPTPNFNAAASNGFQMTLGGNITASTISGVTAGQLIAFYFVQDGVGGRTVSWPGSFVGAAQPDPTANSVSLMLFRADLAGVPRAIGPLASNDGIFAPGLFSAGSLTLIAPGSAGQVLTNVGGVFVPRNPASVDTTQNPPGALNTIYVNPYGCALIVNITCTNTGGTGTNARVGLQCGPNSGSMVEVAADAQNNSSGEMFASMVVPSGYSYQVVGSGSFGGNCVLVHWFENPLL